MSASSVKQGVVFPEYDGSVSTTTTGKLIWQAAVGSLDEALVDGLKSEKDFRHQYPKYLCRLADLGAVSTENALAIARGGLDAVASAFAFINSNGERLALDQAMSSPSKTAPLYSGIITGEAKVASSLQFPPNQGRDDGLELLKELAAFGTCEPDVATSASAIAEMDSTKLQKLLSQHVFVLLGGTSEMGPYLPLVKLGATVVVVARREKKLAALIKGARSTAAGTIVVPTSRAITTKDNDEVLAEVAGADVLTQAPEIAAWLAGLYPDRTMVIGSYIYLDGEAHIRAVVAMDAILTAVTKARPTGLTGAMYLGSPATAHNISKSAWEDSKQRYESQPWYSAIWATPLSFKVNARPLVGETAVTNGMLVFQGPNYALAKTIQLWRAILMQADGALVSLNMAPPCRTYSVVHSAQAKAAIEGMANFAPNRAFDPEFASAVMAALMLFDLTPAGRKVAKALKNPNDITIGNGFHGGNVRCAYLTDSLGPAAYVTGLLGFTA